LVQRDRSGVRVGDTGILVNVGRGVLVGRRVLVGAALLADVGVAVARGTVEVLAGSVAGRVVALGTIVASRAARVGVLAAIVAHLRAGR
jgi:hypothetical protein